MIHIFLTRLSEAYFKEYFEDQISIFPNEFQQRIFSFKRWQDAQASVYGRLLLYWGLSEYYKPYFNNPQIIYNEFKRPFLRNCTLDFNITHSGELVLCAIANKRKVGLDVEKIKSLTIEDFKSQMTASERIRISRSNNRIIAFFDYWTQKEATVKAFGKGLTIPLKSFEIKEGNTEIDGQKWSIKKIYIDSGYSCHLACDQDFVFKKIEISAAEFNIINFNTFLL